jgi:predicted nucleic acid-binding protein
VEAVEEKVKRIKRMQLAKKLAGSLANDAMPEWETTEKPLHGFTTRAELIPRSANDGGMKKILLDTSILVEFSRGREPATSRVDALLASGNDIGVCGINITGFLADIAVEKRREWEQFFDTLHYWHITKAVAIKAAYFRYEYARKGQPLSTQDTIIAAVAHEQNATLFTGNVKDFPMPEIDIMPLESA